MSGILVLSHDPLNFIYNLDCVCRIGENFVTMLIIVDHTGAGIICNRIILRTKSFYCACYQMATE